MILLKSNFPNCAGGCIVPVCITIRDNSESLPISENISNNRGGNSRPITPTAMKIIYKEGSRKTLAESTAEARSAVAKALELVEGKHGFKTPFEIWRNCELVITIGHNIYTTSVEIRPPAMAYIKRRSNWHNRYAYYAAGAFRGNNDNAEVELI